MPLVRFTSDPKLPRDFAHKGYKKGQQIDMTQDEADRWLRRGVAEIVRSPSRADKITAIAEQDAAADKEKKRFESQVRELGTNAQHENIGVDTVREPGTEIEPAGTDMIRVPAGEGDSMAGQAGVSTKPLTSPSAVAAAKASEPPAHLAGARENEPDTQSPEKDKDKDEKKDEGKISEGVSVPKGAEENAKQPASNAPQTAGGEDSVASGRSLPPPPGIVKRNQR